MSNLNKKLDDLGFQMHSPIGELNPYIQCYWSIYLKEELSQPMTNKIISDGGMGIVFNFGHNFSIAIGNDIYTDAGRYFVTGPTEKATYLNPDPAISTG